MKYPPCFPRGYNAAAVDHKAAGERLVSEQSNLPRSIGLPAAHVRIRTIAVVTGLLVAAIIFTAFAVFQRFAAEIRHGATDNLQVLADSKREQIEGVIAERMSDATFIAGIEPV